MKQQPPQNKRTTTPTIVHVARLAGVGIGTASRALNQDNFVSPKTAAKVMEAARQLGYRRNEVARSLKVRRSGAIGIVVPDISWPFMAACVRAAQGILRSRNYISVLTFSDRDSETEAKEIEYLIQRQVDGLLIVPSGRNMNHFRGNLLEALPVVSFDQPVAHTRLDAVLVKNKAGARSAVEHLIGHGHKRIACIGVYRHLYTIRKRIEGYQEAMRESGLEEDLAIIEPTEEEVAAQVDHWMKMKKPPTAIFSLNELASVRLLSVLAARRIRMPDEMAFIGFDDIQLGSLVNPPLTIVQQPAAAVGAQAASLLLERIDSQLEHSPKRISLDTELVIRSSCGCHQNS